ncbi:MAG: aspartyl protease family protein [Planctomycetota bacterium]
MTFAFPLLFVLTAFCQERPRLEEVLARHRASFGSERLLRSTGYRLSGTVRGQGGRRSRYRAWVRRHPFGFREELTPVMPPGPTTVRISDGRYAWRPNGKGPGIPLRGNVARACLENAFNDGFLYLDPERNAGGAGADMPWKLPAWPGVPSGFERDIPAHPVHFRTPAGTLLQFQFGAEDGRLHEIAEIELRPQRWIRFGAWRSFGDVRLPALRVSGSHGIPGVSMLRIEEISSSIKHDPALFASCPVGARPELVRAGKLLVLPLATPGAAHVVQLETVVNERFATFGLIDTGASQSCITPGFAASMRLPLRGRQVFVTLDGMRQTYSRWIDTLRLGDRLAIQITAASFQLPEIIQLPIDRQPNYVIGGEELFADSPVLDLEAGELLFRGRPVPPLEKVGRAGKGGKGRARRIVTVPFRRRNPRSPLITVDVELNGKSIPVLVDTGSPHALFLDGAALELAGLPATRKAWLERGACPYEVIGAGGGGSPKLLGRIPSFRLGKVRFERPLVVIANLEGEPGRAGALLGFGAFLSFARVGIDVENGRLELELRAGSSGGGEVLVPDPGPLLGLTLGSPPAGARTEPLSLPVIRAVLSGTPAARAGLARGDRLLAIEGMPCATQPAYALNRRFWLRPGQRVRFTTQDAKGKIRHFALP